jgi:TolA-binding protein
LSNSIAEERVQINRMQDEAHLKPNYDTQTFDMTELSATISTKLNQIRNDLVDSIAQHQQSVYQRLNHLQDRLEHVTISVQTREDHVDEMGMVESIESNEPTFMSSTERKQRLQQLYKELANLELQEIEERKY